MVDVTNWRGRNVCPLYRRLYLFPNTGLVKAQFTTFERFFFLYINISYYYDFISAAMDRDMIVAFSSEACIEIAK